MTDFTLIAPNGQEIVGTLENLIGTYGVYFEKIAGRDAAIYDHDDNGTDVDWNSQSTAKIDSHAVFVARDGVEWLAAHLIPDSIGALDDKCCELMQREVAIGKAWEASKRCLSMLAKDDPARMFISGGAAVLASQYAAVQNRARQAKIMAIEGNILLAAAVANAVLSVYIHEPDRSYADLIAARDAADAAEAATK